MRPEPLTLPSPRGGEGAALRRRAIPGRLLPPLALGALTLVCFGRLVADPGALIVDARRPSVDAMGPPGVARPPGNDLTRLLLPRHLAIAAHVARTGRLPQWDPSGFGGRPGVGNPQGGLFYPPTWLAWWSRHPAALGWLTVAHLLWGGIGTYTLCRTYGLGRTAGTTAAVCFQASPYVLAQTFEGHYPHVWAATWYPWAFWAVARWRRGDAWGAWLLPPILALTLLTGHPQEGYYLALALGAWAVAGAGGALGRGHRRAAARGLATWAGIGALTLGLVAVELVPVLMAQPWTLGDARFTLGGAGRYHVRAANLLQVPCPRALGRPADYFGPGNSWETMLSLGWAPLVLAVLALRRSPRRTLARGWGILAGGAVAFAAGRSLGLFAVLYEVVPGMDRFRVPARALFLAALAGAVLAGLGIEAIARPADGPGEDWRGWDRGLRLWVALLVLAVLGGAAASRRLGRDDAADRSRPPLPPRGLSGVGISQVVAGEHTLSPSPLVGEGWGGGTRRRPKATTLRPVHRTPHPGPPPQGGREGIDESSQHLARYLPLKSPRGGEGGEAGVRGPARARRERRASVPEWVLGARAGSRMARDGVFWMALAGTTVAFGWLGRRPGDRRGVAAALGIVALAELGLDGAGLLRTAPAGRFLGPDPVGAAVARVRPPGAFRVRARDGFYDDLRAGVLGLEKTNVHDSFQIQHAADLYEALYALLEPRLPGTGAAPMDDAVEGFQRRVRQAVLDRMGVALLITDRPEPGAPWPVGASGTWRGAAFTIYRNPTALPRAYVVPRARPVPDDAAAPAWMPETPPRAAVLMPVDPLGPGGPRQPFTPADYDATDPDRVVIRVTTRAPGLLVVADTWMPGWTAAVDGLPAPVLRGNRAQRVIPLPRPGRHAILLRYRAPGWAAGRAITVASGLAWLGLAIAARTPRRRPLRRSKDPGPGGGGTR